MTNRYNIIIMCSLFLGTQYITSMEIASRPTKSITRKTPSQFDVLPREITHIIIRKLYNITEAQPITSSIEDAIRYYCYLKEIWTLRIGNKIYTVSDMLLLKPQERDVLISLANPSYAKQIVGFSPSLISQQDELKIKKMPKHIRKGLHVDVFHKNPNEYRDREMTCIMCTGNLHWMYCPKFHYFLWGLLWFIHGRNSLCCLLLTLHPLLS